MRIFAHTALCLRDADEIEHLDRASSAASLLKPSCRRSVSPSWRPMVSTGLRLVIGSWKIMLMSLPRILRIAGSSSFSKSVFWKRITPAIRPGGSGSTQGSNGGNGFAATASPTTASVSPSFTWTRRPSTARLTPSGVRKWVWRFRLEPPSQAPSPGAGRARRASRRRAGSRRAP